MNATSITNLVIALTGLTTAIGAVIGVIFSHNKASRADTHATAAGQKADAAGIKADAAGTKADVAITIAQNGNGHSGGESASQIATPG